MSYAILKYRVKSVITANFYQRRDHNSSAYSYAVFTKGCGHRRAAARLRKLLRDGVVSLSFPVGVFCADGRIMR